MSPLSRPDLVERYPLILTCAKNTLFCETQHRGISALRRQALDPEVEMHPSDAAARGIHPGDWVRIETTEEGILIRRPDGDHHGEVKGASSGEEGAAGSEAQPIPSKLNQIWQTLKSKAARGFRR